MRLSFSGYMHHVTNECMRLDGVFSAFFLPGNHSILKQSPRFSQSLHYSAKRDFTISTQFKEG